MAREIGLTRWLWLRRTLGRTGVHVSQLCLGTMMFGAYGNADHQAWVQIIHRALDAGINFIDTADIYSRGESEEIVGRALSDGRRDRGLLATKFVAKWVFSDFVNEAKGDAVLVRTVSVHGQRVDIYRFPRYPAGGPNGSHWAALVEIGDEVVYASLHGERYVDAAIEMAVDLAIRAKGVSGRA